MPPRLARKTLGRADDTKRPSRHYLDRGSSLVTRILDLGSESYSAKWVVLKVLDQKRGVRRNCPFMAEEAEATVFGSLAAKNIQKALKLIFLKMRKQNFNCLEVTKMVENRFLGVPYIKVCTHPYHIQHA
jgi:hypothetical protein